MDHYDTLRVINWIRGEVAAGHNPRSALGATSTPAPWANDRFLTPVLPDDELLFHDWEEEDADAGAATAAVDSSGGPSSIAELARLREENAALRAALEAMQSVMLADDAVRELVADVAAGDSSGDGAGPSASAGSSEQTQREGSDGRQEQQQQQSEAALIDQSYFESYSTWWAHIAGRLLLIQPPCR